MLIEGELRREHLRLKQILAAPDEDQRLQRIAQADEKRKEFVEHL